MDLGSIDLFQLANRKMEWLAARQQVITENVANSDTPGYLAQETESFESYLGGTRTVGVSTTNPMHIKGRSFGGISVKEDSEAWDISPNGNSVSLEQQTIKSSEIAGNYQMIMSLYKKSHNLLSIAASTGK